jgi:uncharacterized peroxidase-related enzyme
LIDYGTGSGPLPDPCTGREQAILPWALKLTHTPSAMKQDDLTPLRSAGLDDEQILEVAHVVGYYAYVNRIVDALGVELEPHMR